MVKRLFIIGIIAFIILSCIILYVNYNSYGEYTINEIKKEYRGVVVKIYSSRKEIGSTFIRIKDNSSRFHDISVLEDVIEYVQVGDSIIKPKNDNVITVKKNGKAKKFYFNVISEKLRNHKKFPKDWKNKWLKDIQK